VKIGLIADTHIPEAGEFLPEMIYDVFKDVDLILHAGDLHILEVLDWLERIAPVKAARGNGDDGSCGRPPVAEDPRLLPVHILKIESIRIGLTHSVPDPEDITWVSLETIMDRIFGGPVDVIVCGSTHVAHVKHHDNVLLVNPGSPTLPNNLVGRLGTVGMLEIENDRASARIIPLGKESNG
jgi:putative phosphoesterase